MLDLETLDTSSTAVVTAVGAVVFDPYSNFIGDSFYRVATDWTDQQRRGRTISGDTVAWWMDQEEAARKALTKPPQRQALPTFSILREFTEFLEGYSGDVEMWGNGADFDNVILGSLFAAYGAQKPWSYSKNRCFRTLNSLPKPKHIILPMRTGTHHNALDDAITQARALQAIFAAQRKVA
jgi:hypothetical protein